LATTLGAEDVAASSRYVLLHIVVSCYSICRNI